MAWKTIVTTERREKARDAAEELCRKVRLDVTNIGDVGQKPHGRVVYTLSVGWGHCAIDIGFMPRLKGGA